MHLSYALETLRTLGAHRIQGVVGLSPATPTLNEPTKRIRRTSFYSCGRRRRARADLYEVCGQPSETSNGDMTSRDCYATSVTAMHSVKRGRTSQGSNEVIKPNPRYFSNARASTIAIQHSYRTRGFRGHRSIGQLELLSGTEAHPSRHIRRSAGRQRQCLMSGVDRPGQSSRIQLDQTVPSRRIPAGFARFHRAKVAKTESGRGFHEGSSQAS
jgi:hypothetical protein